MNDEITVLDFSQIKIGMEKKFRIVVTEYMLESFANLSGDYNPLHMNENYATNTSFRKRICHGMLLSSFLSRLVGMYLPGQNALYISQSLKFHSPCFVNDKITIIGKVVSKSESTHIITLKTIIVNESGNCLVDGEAKVLLRE
ncbi:MaoC family dehydratase [Nitrosopumilus piranensis]|uniref:MaoC-like protein n=1 Tax=Nitrosopumilus piranensis TaxID=1582439 RepID=A0A0C5BWD7_9ARCH|nr:MaoC family dehydratase [Nitrosopumilus piranensis]AJM91295.1 MaoC-like protein [Nitrosopumilus piranensis]